MSVITASVLHLKTPVNDFDVQMCGSEGDHEMTYNFEIVEGDYPDEYDEILIEDRYREFIAPECLVGDSISLICRDHSGNIKTYDFIVCGFAHVKDIMPNSMMGLLTVDRAEGIFHDLGEDIEYFVSVNVSDRMNPGDRIRESLLDYFDEYIEKYGNREAASEYWKRRYLQIRNI